MGDFYTVLGGRVKLTHADGLQRPSEDAIWLASTVNVSSPDSDISVLDVGAGTGAVGLTVMALNGENITCYFVENDPIYLDNLKDNLSLSANNSRARVLNDDVFHSSPARTYDVVVSNPPYYLKHKGHGSSSAAKSAAHYITEEHLKRWVQYCLDATAKTGQLSLVLHTDAYVAVKYLLAPYAYKYVELHTSSSKPCKRVIIILRKGVSANLKAYRLHCYDTDIRDAVLARGEPLLHYVKEM